MSKTSAFIKKNMSVLLWYILMTALAAFFLLPIIWMFFTAFMTPPQTAAYPPKWIPNPWSIQAFVIGFGTIKILRSVGNTVYITLMCVIGNLLSSSLVAFGFARLNARYKNQLFMILLGTMMIPGTVTLIPTYVLYARLGLINTFAPLIIPAFLGGSAFSIFLLRQFFQTLPRDLAESAMIDGCSWFKIYLNIYLPNTKPALIVVMIFTFVGSWNDFFGPMIFLLDPAKYTLAVFLSLLRNQFGTASNLPTVMAMSLLSVTPIIALFFFAQKYFVQGIVTTGLKG